MKQSEHKSCARTNPGEYVKITKSPKGIEENFDIDYETGQNKK